MFHLIYFIPFFLSIALFPIQVHFFKKHTSVYYVALFISIIVCCIGHLQLSYATNVEAALFANQTLYLGSVFTPFFSFLCVAELLRIRIPTFIKGIFFVFAILIFTAVSLTGTVNLYYKSVDIATWHGMTYLIKTYGPLHNSYPIFLTTVVIITIVLICISFRRKRQVSFVTCIALFISMIISFCAYIFERVFDLKFELIPVAFNIEQICIIFLLNRISLYDISGITADTMMNSNSYGIVTFKSRGRYIGYEGGSCKWFPEINELQVDLPIPDSLAEKSDFIFQIKEWLNGADFEEPEYFERDGKIIEAKFSVLNTKRDRNIYAVTLRDDTKQQQLNRLIKDYNENLERMVNDKIGQVKKIQEDIIISMASIVENRDGNTGGHIKRTSDIMRIFVNSLKKTNNFSELNSKTSEAIIKAASLHDFGKVAIPDSILNKPGKFTDEEYSIMKLHSQKGAVIVAQILQNSDDVLFNNIAINVAHYHHEKWDGTGYPVGLNQKDIPFEARVMALADVFDALVSKRVYKDQFSYDKAFGIIEESCGKHFDPVLCAEFLKCRPKLEALYNSYED